MIVLEIIEKSSRVASYIVKLPNTANDIASKHEIITGAREKYQIDFFFSYTVSKPLKLI